MSLAFEQLQYALFGLTIAGHMFCCTEALKYCIKAEKQYDSDIGCGVTVRRCEKNETGV
jgi:hypothetical protein